LRQARSGELAGDSAGPVSGAVVPAYVA